jgi:hypothetical protein
MTKPQRRAIISHLLVATKASFDRIDQLEKEGKLGLEHTIARERLYDNLKMRDLLKAVGKEAKSTMAFSFIEFHSLDHLITDRTMVGTKKKYGWFDWI